MRKRSKLKKLSREDREICKRIAEGRGSDEDRRRWCCLNTGDQAERDGIAIGIRMARRARRQHLQLTFSEFSKNLIAELADNVLNSGCTLNRPGQPPFISEN